MSKRLTRQQIYELVWTEPTRTVAAQLGVSDVALAKTCRKADIPIPPRGYWARKEANQKVFQTPLPPRFPGAGDEYEIGGGKNYWQPISEQEMLDMPVPPLLEYSETVEALTQRVEKLVGKVAVQRDFSRAFGDISRLLAHDEDRRRSQWSFEKPRRRSPDIQLARIELDWKPRTELGTGLKQTIAYAEDQLRLGLPITTS